MKNPTYPENEKEIEKIFQEQIMKITIRNWILYNNNTYILDIYPYI